MVGPIRTQPLIRVVAVGWRWGKNTQTGDTSPHLDAFPGRFPPMTSPYSRVALLAALLCTVSTLRAEDTDTDAEPLTRFVLVAKERPSIRLKDLAAELTPWAFRRFVDPFDSTLELPELAQALGSGHLFDSDWVVGPPQEGVLLALFDDQEVAWSPSLVWHGPVVSIDLFEAPL